MIFLIGPIPPPVHGASLVTAQVARILATSGVTHVACSVSPRPGARGIVYHFSRIAAVSRNILRLVCHRSKDPTTVYLSLSGGWGLVYDLLTALVARARGFSL